MSSLSYWHHRLSHPALPIVSHILCRHCLSFMLDSPPFTYSAYPMGKAHQFSFPSFSYAQFEKSLELVWANIWGLAPYLSIMSFKYYLSIVDYFTRFTWFFPLKLKSDILTVFRSFIVYAKRFFNTKLIFLKTDVSGEFISLNSLCKLLGITHRFSCPHTYQKNEIVERKHHHIMKTGLALLAHASLPFTFWANTFETTTYLINFLPIPILNN